MINERNAPANVSCSFGILVSSAKLASKIVSASPPSHPMLQSSPANLSGLGFNVGFKFGGGVGVGSKLGRGVGSGDGAGLGFGVGFELGWGVSSAEGAGFGVGFEVGLSVGDGAAVDKQFVLLHSCSR